MHRVFPASFSAGLTFCARTHAPRAVSVTAVLRGAAALDLAATQDESGWAFLIAAPDTAAWVAGRYWYQILATYLDGTVRLLESGSLRIDPDLSSAEAGFNGASHAENVLAAIEAVIEGRASMDQERYRINNRELTRTPISELIKLRDYYWQLVQMERAKASGASLFTQARGYTTPCGWLPHALRRSH